MKKENYDITITGNYLIINRSIFPRIKVYLCRKQPRNEVVRIKVIDKCQARELAPAIEDLDQFISELNPLKLSSLEFQTIPGQ